MKESRYSLQLRTSSKYANYLFFNIIMEHHLFQVQVFLKASREELNLWHLLDYNIFVMKKGFKVFNPSSRFTFIWRQTFPGALFISLHEPVKEESHVLAPSGLGTEWSLLMISDENSLGGSCSVPCQWRRASFWLSRAWSGHSYKAQLHSMVPRVPGLHRVGCLAVCHLLSPLIHGGANDTWLWLFRCNKGTVCEGNSWQTGFH